MARVHILGNSGAYGFNENDTSWPSLIKADANRRRRQGQQPRMTTVSLASPGNMLRHILESSVFEASVKCNQRGRQIGIFSVGTCEASILRSLGQEHSRRSKVDFSHDLDELAEVTQKLNAGQSQENSVSVILLGTFPADGKKSLCTPEGDYFNDGIILDYNEILQKKAAENGTAFVDLRTGFNSNTMLADDGIHPNVSGDSFIYTKVMPVLLSTLGIQDPQT